MNVGLRLHRLPLALGLAGCVLGSSWAVADDAPRNTKPYTRYKILLGQLVNGTLPFDVPFIIWGDVDEAMTEDIEHAEVTLLSAEFKSEESCKDIPEKTYRRLRTAKVAKWTDQDFTDRDLTPPTEPVVRARHQFEMLIPPLEPRRVYCFLFQVSPGRPADSAQQASLIAAIQPAYQRFLRELGVLKALGDEEAEQLRKDLSRAMMAAVPLRGVTPRKGSVFDPDASKEVVAAEFREPMARVLTEHNRAVQKLARLQSFDVTSRNLSDLQQWRKWSRSTAFRKFADEAATTGTRTEELRALAAMTDEEVKRAMVGLPAAGPDEVISDLWQVDHGIGEPEEFGSGDPCPTVQPLSARCQAIDQLHRRLEAAAATLRSLPARTGTPAGDTPESLATEVDRSVRHFGERKVNLLEVQLAINARHTAMVEHIGHLQTLVATSWHSVVTTEGDLATRRSWYMSADTGLAFGVSINEVLPYAGTNLYFRPVNTEAPPGKFLTRFSALIGFTWTDNILKEGERASLYGTSVSLVLGAGVRLTEILKVSGGVLMFKGLDPNPTIQDTRLEVSPFVSISGDFDVAKLLGGLFGNDATGPKTLGAGTKPE